MDPVIEQKERSSAPERETTGPELSATGEPAAEEHVALAVRSLAAGVIAGVAGVAVMMWLVRTLQASGVAPLAPGPSDSIANLILLGWLGGAGLGAVVAWTLLSPLVSAYRRGGLSMVAGFGTLLVAFVTAPVDSFFGRWGLLGLAALLTLGFVVLLWRNRSAPS